MAQPHVLIVDDDPGILGLSQVLVARQSLQAHVARDGEEALEKIRGNEYSAILLDLFLPRISGFDVIRHLRQSHPHLLSRVIVVTAANPALPFRAEEYEIWKLVRKPFDVHDFMSVVSACATYHHDESESGEGSAAPGSDPSARLPRFFEQLSLRAGAQRGVVTFRSQKDELSVQSSFGYPPQSLAEFSSIPVSSDTPMSVAFRKREPVWVSSPEELERSYPDLAPICRQFNSSALAAAPLICGKEVVGAMGWSFSEAQPFDADQQRQLKAISIEYQHLMTRLETRPLI